MTTMMYALYRQLTNSPNISISRMQGLIHTRTGQDLQLAHCKGLYLELPWYMAFFL